MKTKFKRIGRQSVSVILAVMMMVSTMLVGMVTSYAADFPTNKVIYFKAGDTDKDGARFACYFFGNGETWLDMTLVDSTNKVYKVTTPSDKSYTNIIICRMNGTSTKNNWDNRWNQSDNLSYDGTNNCYQFSSYVDNSNKFNGSWTTYAETTTNHNVTVTFSNATVTLDDDSVTSGTPVSVTNADTHTLTVAPASGYSLTSVKNGSTELGTSGEYTLAAGSDDVNITVTTAKEYEFYLTGYMNENIGTDKGYKFTKESDGVYTYVITPSSTLYATVTDKSNNKLYAPASYDPINVENTWSTISPTENGGEKWGIKSDLNKEIKITWDITGGISNGKIKWEYTTQVTKPTATLTAGANEVYFGKNVSLTPGYTLNPDDDTVTANESYSVSPDTATVTDNTFTVPKSLGESKTSISYTVTYTVTLSNGESDSASVTITAKDSAEQTAYKALLAGLGTSTYPDPSTYTGKTAATVAAYKTAYDAAVAVKNVGYPDANGTANTTAKSDLDDAQSKLADKTSLPKPVLAVQEGNSVKAGSSINLYISNESSYPDAANVTFEIYNENNTTTPVATISKGQKANIMSVAVGANKYYAKVVLGNTDDYSLATAQSATITVTGVEMVTVKVSAGDNGTAYISKYYDVNNTEKTSTNLTSVSVKKGTAVTFTAVPNSGFQVASWNGTASTDTTYTTTVSADTTVSVTFEEQPIVEVALLGKTLTIDTTSTSNQFTDGLSFVNNQAIIEVSGNSNWFGFVDSNGNYYNVSTNTEVSSGKTYTVNKVVNAPASGCVSWISASTSTFYKLTITEFIPGTSLTYKLEKISTPWRIYGDSTYFSSYGWDTPSSGAPISLSYKGNANQYYYPLEMTAGSTAYFGFYYNSKQHRPSQASSTNMALPTADGTVYINDYTGRTTGAFTVTADTAGTYYICIDTYSSRAWYEKAVTEPVTVTLDAVTVEGGNAYISSYTDNSGNVVSNPTETTVYAKSGTNVSFKADDVDGYYVKWQTSLDTTVATGNTFTLSNVSGTDTISVTATYVKIETYNVTVKAQTGGSVTATLGGSAQDVRNPISVASNEVITLKATPDTGSDYVFKGWEVNTTNYTLSGGTTINDAEIQVTPLANVTFTAMFEIQQGEVDSTYQLMLSSADNGIPNDSTGSTKVKNLTFYKTTDENNVDTYSVTVPTATFSSTGNNYFAFSTTGKNSGIPQYSTAPTLTVDTASASAFKSTRIQENGRYKFPHFQFTDSSTVLSVKISYTPSTHTYTLSAVTEAPLEDALDVYVTNGNLVGLKYGSTKIISGITEKYYKEDAHSSYIKYRVKSGDKVTVECTMDDAKAKLGYYVYAFVVNGAKVDAVQSSNGVYQTATPVTITEKTEITPVYYNTVIEANGDYVTLYVNVPDELATKWGSSISIYSWYKNSGANMDGDYPGQLMMRDTQGKYVAKISRYSYATDSNGKFVRQETQNIAGITINNYYENQGDVHQKFLSGTQLKNRQSYDYNDFVKIAQMGYDTVEFDVKYYENTGTGSNPVSNQSAILNNAHTFGTAPKSKTLSDSLHVTDYQNLTNIDGKLVSILGYDDQTIRTIQGNKGETVTGLITNEKLHIISVGNQNNKPNGGTAQWATCWYVYDSNGDYVTYGLPSDFIPSGTIDENGDFVEDALASQSSAYQEIVANGLQYTSAEISYEVELDAAKSVTGTAGNSGIRCDGRWYYARSADTVAVDLGIIYKTDENDTVWTVDKPTADSDITGTVTGATASFSYTDSIGNTHTNLASDSVERNTVLSINATNGTKYKFIGWAVPTYNADGTFKEYTPLNLTDYNATYTVSTATKLYAMYVPYASRELTLTHSKYVGADAHNGLGLFTIEAYLCYEDGTPINPVSTASVSDSVTLEIQNLADTYVKVTLFTQSYAKSHFLNFYYPTVSNGTTTLTKDGNLAAYYDKECTADNQATNSFMVKVSDLFVDDTQVIMALNYYSDLKLPEVASNITFNYNPYNQAPEQNPAAQNGTGKTTFTLTITDKDGNNVYTSNTGIGSLTLKGNTELKDILADLTANGNDYTITLTLDPQADSHCAVGTTYRQNVGSDGTYTYTDATSDTGTWTYDSAAKTYSAKLSDLFNTTDQVFYSNTINFFTDFTADEFNYNVTFKYLGYESREYYDENGYGQDMIPDSAIDQNWWKTYTVSGTFYGADIDKYFDYDSDEGSYKFKEAFLLKVAPYEDNFVQSITWDLTNVEYPSTNAYMSLTATVNAKYDNGSVIVTAVLPDGASESYTVNYASLVTKDNYIGTTTLPDDKTDYLIVAPEEYNSQKFSYWSIQNDNGIEVAKCFNKEFNYLAYDNYTVTACYGKDDVDTEKQKVSATMTFLEYSRNQYDTGKDKVYADFAVSYNYNGKMLNADKNANVICGVAFVVNSNYSSPSDATQAFTVAESDLLAMVKALNSGSTSDKTIGDAKVYNYKINKTNLDNKNRLEYSWNVTNSSNNQNLTILAYSYIYNTETDKYSISAPQTFKFYNVGNKSYEA